jgi:Na+/H+-dicarboxylate symporter
MSKLSLSGNRILSLWLRILFSSCIGAICGVYIYQLTKNRWIENSVMFFVVLIVQGIWLFCEIVWERRIK